MSQVLPYIPWLSATVSKHSPKPAVLGILCPWTLCNGLNAPPDPTPIHKDTHALILCPWPPANPAAMRSALSFLSSIFWSIPLSVIICVYCPHLTTALLASWEVCPHHGQTGETLTPQ